MFETTQLSALKLKETLDVLRGHDAEDFKGRTEFYRMSAQQRLAWLDGAVAFIRDAKNANRELIQGSERGKT
jgi:hypothetical protein